MQHEVEIFESLEQGTDEWKQLRAGVITASRASRLVTSKGEKSKAGFDDLVAELTAETITGELTDFHVNDAMKRGTELEPQARSAFGLFSNYNVEQVGFIKIKDRAVGCSPDGIIVTGEATKDLLEIKCPLPKTHIKYLDGPEVVPTAYVAQCQFQLYVTGSEIVHFFSYNPSMKPFYLKVKRDEKFQKLLHEHLLEAEEAIKIKVEKHRS